MSTFNPTKKQRANLDKLATYLESLPEDYQEFDMTQYYDDYSSETIPSEVVAGAPVPCGSAACAIGHGPAAGVRTYKDDSWEEYASRAFGASNFGPQEGEYMFDADMGGNHWDAAKRIRTVLAGEFNPEEHSE